VRQPGGWGRNPATTAKPAIEVATDPGAEELDPAPNTGPQPGRSPSSSTCEPYRELIELGLSRGRNARAIWQDLVDDYGFTGRNNSVKRYVRKQRGGTTLEARVAGFEVATHGRFSGGHRDVFSLIRLLVRGIVYQATAFREERLEILQGLIRAHPLATLITFGTGGLLANLVPFILSDSGEKGTLLAHVAKANDQVDALKAGAETLVVFQGPEAYITPSWYASKKEHGRVVPTWNYVVVQVRGTPRVIDDSKWLLAQITELTSQQEHKRAEPWQVTDAPHAFVDGQLKAIIGVEIPISTIQGKWKVSQNRSVADRRGVYDGLHGEGINEEMAKLVAEKS
jgi:transcriptional regulator